MTAGPRKSDDAAGAVCMVRDAVDIAPITIGHYLRLGFDQISVVDDGSTDGTFELLGALAANEPRLCVSRARGPHFNQAGELTDASNRLIADGITIVFPFDIDEFWDIDLRIIGNAARQSDGVFIGRWVQFVQRRRSLFGPRLDLLRIGHRAPDLVPPDLAAQSSHPFVCHRMPKVGFKSEHAIALVPGSHALASGPMAVLLDGLDILHIPFRSRAALEVRAGVARRILVNGRPGHHWQSAQIAKAAESGTLDLFWAANSASADGYLDNKEERVHLLPDARLKRILIKSLAYMVLRHPKALMPPA